MGRDFNESTAIAQDIFCAGATSMGSCDFNEDQLKLISIKNKPSTITAIGMANNLILPLLNNEASAAEAKATEAVSPAKAIIQTGHQFMKTTQNNAKAKPIYLAPSTTQPCHNGSFSAAPRF